MNNDHHFTRDVSQFGRLTNHPLVYYLVSFLLGAGLLSLLSLGQRVALGASRIGPTGFVVPILFGGCSGVIVGLWRRSQLLAYKRLNESNSLYRLLVEQASDGIFIADAQGNYLDVNSSGCALLGYTRAEILQLNMRDIIPDGERDAQLWDTDKLQAGEHILVKRNLIRKDGSLLLVEISAKELPDGRLQGIVRDITERERTAAALQEQEERLRTLINASPDTVFFKDGDGRWLVVNNMARQIFALEQVDYQGKTDIELAEYSPFYREAFLTCVTTDEAAWANPPLSRSDETLFQLDGSYKVYDVIKVPLFHEDGRRKALVVLGRDITERKQAEEALRQAQKTESLGVLAGGIAHDFNNLLVAMLGQTSLALAKLRDENPARPHVEKAVHAAERAADLTRQMLAYSGRGHFETRAINLNHLITENLHLFRASLPKNVTWRTELTATLPYIQADPGQMQQVIMNLIINGAQAIEDNPGMVTVVTGVQELDEDDGRYHHYTGKKLSPGSYVTLEVHDNGKGMAPEALSKIFDPFFTTKESGRGLGLAAVLGIVRGHKGGLYVYSEPEQGTTFKLLFPIIQELEAEKPVVDPLALMPSEVGKVKVLVIDDEAPVREAVVDILAMSGIEVIVATNGAEGIAFYQEQMADINLVILDLSMPGMNGKETFQQLRRIDPQVRVILSSGYNQVEATRHFLGKGLAAFLQKPFNAVDLLATVKKYMN